MIRKFIPVDRLQIFDDMHKQAGASFVVDETKDGQTTEEHKKGIEHIKNIIRAGQKVLPPLVMEDQYGDFHRLDGFKRCMAFLELGYESIEAFVCTEEEYRQAAYVPFRDGEMRCYHGGQYDDKNKRRFPLLEGGEGEKFDYDKVKFLYKSPKGDGLRIELCEAVHVHWGPVGSNRLILGRNDFVALAEAISKI